MDKLYYLKELYLFINVIITNINIIKLLKKLYIPYFKKEPYVKHMFVLKFEID